MITPRLEMILRHAAGETIADIGTDHGYVPIELARRGKKVIATDISAGPLGAARKNIEKAGVDVKLRLGAGTEPLAAGEADCIIIAGMGGEMIEKIIRADFEKARGALLILQPMNSQYELRKFLAENDFCVTAEDLAAEGHKVYNLLAVKSGEPNGYETEADYHLPPLLYENPLFERLADKKIREFRKIGAGLAAGGKPSERYEKLAEDAELIKERICGGMRNENV